MAKRIPHSILGLGIFVVLTCANWTSDNAGRDQSWRGEKINSHGTDISAVLDAPIQSGKNLLWCGSFQLAWNAAGETTGFPIKLTPRAALADALNKRAFDRKWIDEASIYVRGGRNTPQLNNDIRATTREKWNREPKFLDGTSLKKDDFVFYAVLHKVLHFPKPFAKLGSKSLAGHDVPCFGYEPDQTGRMDLLPQVLVHHYQDAANFVVELKTNDHGDQLVLAKLPAAKSLAEMSASTIKRLRTNAAQSGANDRLIVPYFICDEKKSFQELIGHHVDSLPGEAVQSALQSIELLMDEKGVKLHSEAKMSFGCAASVPVVPRDLILSPPFLLLMKRDAAPTPYFVAWIGNADLLKN